MFRFTRKPSSGSHSQYLAKITHSVQCGYMEVVQTMSVLGVKWLQLVVWSGVGLWAMRPGSEQLPSTRTHSPQPHTRPHDQL